MLTLIVVGSVAAEEVVERVTSAILPQALRNLPGLTFVYRQVGRTMQMKNTTMQQIQHVTMYFARALKMPEP